MILFIQINGFLYFIHIFFLSISANIDSVAEFELRRHLILDCWMLYQYKYFQGDQNNYGLEHFPMWNSSKEVSKMGITLRIKYPDAMS